MKAPKISVIVPVYNVENYVNETLESIVGQTYKDYEVILINDGSTDSSSKIIQEYAKKYDNFYYYSQKNIGLSATRNSGINISRGKYIYFMDSDDTLEPDTLEILYTESKKNNLNVLMFSGKSFLDRNFDEGNTRVTFDYMRNHMYKNVENGQEMFSKLIKNNDYYSSACLYLLERDNIIKNNIYFRTGIVHEDELFTFELLMRSERVGAINNILFNRRIRKDSITTNKNYLKSFNGYYTVLFEMYNIINQNEFKSNNIYKSAILKLTQIYSYTVNRYINLSKEKREQVKPKIINVKKMGVENKFFHRIEFKIFNYSEKLYSILYNYGKKVYRLRKEKKN